MTEQKAEQKAEVIGPVNEKTARGEQVLVKLGRNYYVVSSVAYVPRDIFGNGGPETLVFRSDRRGNVTDWGDVAGGPGISREEAIADLEQNGPRRWMDRL